MWQWEVRGVTVEVRGVTMGSKGCGSEGGRRDGHSAGQIHT